MESAKETQLRVVSFGVILGLVAFVTYIAQYYLHVPFMGIDDAEIFKNYAENFINGHGFVYYVGGPRVEGFTSLLWVLFWSAAFLLGSPELILIAVNVVLTSLSAHRVFWFSKKVAPHYGVHISPKMLFALVLGWVLSSPTFIIWMNVSLMDVSLWSTVVVFGLTYALEYLLFQEKVILKKLSIVIFLAIITRPESLIMAGVWIASIYVGDWFANRKKKKWFDYRATLIFTYILSVTALTSFRLIYFGYPLPNTYYAKMSPDMLYNLSEGALYLSRFFVNNPVSFFVFLTCLWHVFFMEKKRFSTLSILCYCTLAMFALPVIKGGDHFVFYRFYQAYWTSFFLATFFICGKALTGLHPKVSVYSATISIWILFASTYVPWHQLIVKGIIIRDEFLIAHEGRTVGSLLNEMKLDKKLPSVGVYMAGGIANTYEGKIIDLMGLNTIEFAHSDTARHGIKNHAAFDRSIFYKSLPDVFLPSSKKYRLNIFHGTALHYIWREKKV